MTIQLIGQLLGFVSTALFLLSFQFKQNKQLFALQLGSFAFTSCTISSSGQSPAVSPWQSTPPAAW